MNKRLFELKKELRQVKKMMDKHNRYCKKKGLYPKSWSQYEWGLHSSYTFITSDGNSYILDVEDNIFPDVNISKTIYICCNIPRCSWKKNGKIYHNNDKYQYYDSNIGYFNISDNFNYFKNIEEKFKVTKYN